MEKRFKRNMMLPMFHRNRLFEPVKLKKPSLIFTGSAGDMFGDFIKPSWIKAVFDICNFSASHHTYQFLTKNPVRYEEFCHILPENGWYGTTCDGTYKTIDNIRVLKDVPGNFLKFVSFEPLLEDPVRRFDSILPLDGIDWIIIGADSTPGAKKPPYTWADRLIYEAKEIESIPVFVKDNYGYHKVLKEMP